jgi:DamX protein
LLTVFPLLAIAADTEDEEVPEEGWYCIPDPTDGGWACGIGEAPPITVPQPPPGVRPREDYTAEIQPLQEPGAAVVRPIPAESQAATADPGPAASQSDDTLFRSTPFTPAAEPSTPTTESSGPTEQPSAVPSTAPASQPGGGDFVIQLVGARDPDNVDAFIERHQLSGQAFKIHTWLDGESWYVLVMGPYPDYETANQALESLPEGLRTAGPFVRRRGEVE